MNPWITHGRELNQLLHLIAHRLSWKQYQRWTASGELSYRVKFASVAKVSASKRVLALAADGLRLVERCESVKALQDEAKGASK